jgi:hypothetical protein
MKKKEDKKQLGSFTSDWDAKEYLKEYYSGDKINDDELVTLKYLVNFLKKSGKVFDKAIDIGSGPTLHQIIPFIPYVKELHLSDFVPENLAEIKKWLNEEPDAHDWDKYIQYVLELEGKGETIKKRKKEMRRVITKLLFVDIFKKHPLVKPAVYPLVTSFYCIDGAAQTKEKWKEGMANLFPLVDAGGVLIMAAVRNADFYRVLGRHFPSPHVNEDDFLASFKADGNFPKNLIDVQIISNAEWVEAGFDSCIFVKAEKRKVSKKK